MRHDGGAIRETSDRQTNIVLRAGQQIGNDKCGQTKDYFLDIHPTIPPIPFNNGCRAQELFALYKKKPDDLPKETRLYPCSTQTGCAVQLIAHSCLRIEKICIFPTFYCFESVAANSGGF
jgi:hypothetical protein